MGAVANFSKADTVLGAGAGIVGGIVQSRKGQNGNKESF